ncbi:uncharacterized protein LOC131636743 [Vicia villosa]|uniref:uncharacterized protein LOC131636743 n=1 Tax=Vicia villosa TaxID=3911 RepID=UPI00273C4215|nr:uncharacterized protein LOC131636743 [Vicia villosa]
MYIEEIVRLNGIPSSFVSDSDSRFMSRDSLNHSPIRLNCGVIDWGPKPFRFNNAVLEHEGFKDFINEEWAKLVVDGRGDFILFEKLKRLKERLKSWNREVFGWIDLNISNEVETINDMDKLLVDNFGSDMESVVEARRKASNNLWKCLNVKESMLRFKSRQFWLNDDDNNTLFFHNSLKDRRRKNAISVLEGADHFESFFHEENKFRVVPEGIDLNILNNED